MEKEILELQDICTQTLDFSTLLKVNWPQHSLSAPTEDQL